MLGETLRWNDEFKLYSAKVYTAEQAQMNLDAMRMVSEKDERDLASVTVDETATVRGVASIAGEQLRRPDSS